MGGREVGEASLFCNFECADAGACADGIRKASFAGGAEAVGVDGRLSLRSFGIVGASELGMDDGRLSKLGRCESTGWVEDVEASEPPSSSSYSSSDPALEVGIQTLKPLLLVFTRLSFSFGRGGIVEGESPGNLVSARSVA